MLFPPESFSTASFYAKNAANTRAAAKALRINHASAENRLKIRQFVQTDNKNPASDAAGVG
jgi:hypothetical protein